MKDFFETLEYLIYKYNMFRDESPYKERSEKMIRSMMVAYLLK